MSIMLIAEATNFLGKAVSQYFPDAVTPLQQYKAHMLLAGILERVYTKVVHPLQRMSDELYHASAPYLLVMSELSPFVYVNNQYVVTFAVSSGFFTVTHKETGMMITVNNDDIGKIRQIAGAFDMPNLEDTLLWIERRTNGDWL